MEERTAKQKTEENVQAFCCLGAFLSFFVFFMGVVISTNEDNKVYLLFIFGGLFLFVSSMYKFVKISKKHKYVSSHLEFLKKCYEEKIYRIETDYEYQKAKLVAESLNISVPDIKTFFEEALEVQNAVRKEHEQAELEKEKEEERKLYVSLNRFSDFHGRDKRIAMLTEARAKALKEAENRRMGAIALQKQITRSETNWAITGGLVSGVAGPIAGAAAAVDTELRNIQIREQNANAMRDFAPVFISASNSEAGYREQAAAIAEEIEAAKTKLVSTAESSENCLDYLRFSNGVITVSKTGTCYVQAIATAKKKIMILGDTSAVVDGVVNATILDGDKALGTAKMVLPPMGIAGNTSVKLMGMCLDCGASRQAKNYTIKFSADNLWLMEK